MKKIKALVLLSGGLDSMLAVKILQEQNIEVAGISFVSNFYNADRARKAAEQLGVPLRIVDIKEDMLELTKNPPNGHGKHMNPCIDCHALMIRKAAEFHLPLVEETRASSNNKLTPPNLPLKERDYQIIATGEVVGQRPFSQTKEALERVRKYSKIEVLRPLSAKLLPETEYEKKGLVDRSKLLDIAGRRRERQTELAKKYGIKEYPSPGGGCMLTEAGFSDKLKAMIENWPDCDNNDVELLKNGRPYWINDKILIVVGRNQRDNEALDGLARKGDMLVELEDQNGPTTLVRIKNYELKITNETLETEIPDKFSIKDLKLEEGKNEEDVLKIAGLLTGWHTPKARGKNIKFKVKSL